MKHTLSKISTKAIVSMALVVFVACDRSDGDLGLPYVDDDRVNYGVLESTPIVMYSTSYDSVRSNSPETGVGMFGGYNDPVFGRTDAVVVSHLVPSGVPSFGSNPVCDSAFLFIPYTLQESAWYGDTTAQMQVFVNTLRDFMDPDSNYYSNRVFATDQEIGNLLMDVRPRKKVLYEHTTVARPFMKVPINQSFANDIIFPLEGTGAFESAESFINQFYGISLSSDANAEAIIGLLMPSTDTKLRMYFRNDDGDTSFYDLRITSSGEFVNTFQRDYSTAIFDLETQDSINGEDAVYIQGLGGVCAALDIPNIREYQDSGWLMNRAEIELPVQEGSANGYRLPNRLQIVRDDTAGRRIIHDYFTEGPSAVGGGLTTGELRDHTYRFVITRQMQRYLENKDTTVRFLILPEIAVPDQTRAVINGNLSTLERAQLKLYYTRTQ